MSVEPSVEILYGFSKGLLYGLFSTGIGYIKNETMDTFDPIKLLKTMIIGGFVGGIFGATGLSLSDFSAIAGGDLGIDGLLMETFIMTAVVSFADRLVKVIARRTDLMKLWNKIKEFLQNK